MTVGADQSRPAEAARHLSRSDHSDWPSRHWPSRHWASWHSPGAAHRSRRHRWQPGRLRRPSRTSRVPRSPRVLRWTSSASRSVGPQPRRATAVSYSSRPRARTRRHTCSSTGLTARSSARHGTAAAAAMAGASWRINARTRAGASSGAAPAAPRAHPVVPSRPEADRLLRRSRRLTSGRASRATARRHHEATCGHRVTCGCPS